MKQSYCLILILSSFTIHSQINEEGKTKTDSILSELVNDGDFEYELVGRGFPSTKYLKFIELCSISNESEFNKLLKHKHPVVKAYAYWGLVNINPNSAYRVLKKHRFDFQSIHEQNGCLGGTTQMRFLMANLLTTKSDQLSPKQITYLDRIGNKEVRYIFRKKKAHKKRRNKHLRNNLNGI